MTIPNRKQSIQYIAIFFILLTALAWLGSFGAEDVLVIVFFGLLGGGLYPNLRGRKETHHACRTERVNVPEPDKYWTRKRM